ncbi:MAG: CHASE2 domain-containing protein [Synechococcales bacterium]|nr:CHASE2 domain-containing protein [Synechococcales bacterium]
MPRFNVAIQKNHLLVSWLSKSIALFRSGLGLSILGSTCLSVSLQWTGIWQFLDWQLWDQGVKLRSPRSIMNRIVLVTIDEPDIQRWGYPITDQQLAQLLLKLRQQQPRVIGLDIYRDQPVAPGSAQLQQIFRTTPNLIGIERLIANRNSYAVAPPPILKQQNQVAASDVLVDTDGKVRRGLISLWDRAGKTHFTLGARLALNYLATQQITPQEQGNGKVQLGLGQFHALNASEGGYVGVDNGGYQILSHYEPTSRQFLRLSMTDVLQERVNLNSLRDRIVIIGAIAPSVGDRFYTAFSTGPETTWSGLEIHATVTQQILTAALDGHQPLRGLPGMWTPLWILMWSGIGGYVGWQIRTWGSGAIAVFLMVGGFFASGYFILLLGWWMPMVGAMVGLALSGLTSRSYWAWRRLHRSHQLLSAYSNTLKQEVAARTQELVEKNHALQIANQKAEAASRAKSSFLANMNHELRTPLTIILGCSELLRGEANLTPAQCQRLIAIDRSVETLLTLINDVLDLSRAEAGMIHLNLAEFDFPEFLGELQDLFVPQAIAQQLQLSFITPTPMPQCIVSDRAKIRQILINLLGNACKFTQAGSILLRVTATQHLLRLDVEDTGVGIDHSELATIFEPFVQAQAGHQANQGTGLGLAICQQFVELMGGQLSVQSQLGQGSCFCLELPVQILTWSTVSLAVSTPTIAPVALPASVACLEPGDLSHLPYRWRSELQQAALRLSPDRCQRLIAQLPTTEMAIAQALLDCVDNFQFEQITNLLVPTLVTVKSERSSETASASEAF